MRTAMIMLCAALTACAPAGPVRKDMVDPELARIEADSGGRLGVALLADGRVIAGHRADERFAMCSTFKLVLAAAVLDGASQGRWSLRDVMTPAADDPLSHSPSVKRWMAESVSVRVEASARAAVEESDNSASNMLLRLMGGPDKLTAWLREKGDATTRLDRYEMALNENAPGDPRDTTTPAAYAGISWALLVEDGLPRDAQAKLTGWMVASETGLKRIRAGLPAGWSAGDKTGTCGTAYNDVALITMPSGRRATLAVYLDRPTVDSAQANAAIKQVGSWAAAKLSRP